MPYDPTPVGPDVDATGHRDTLTVHVAGSRAEPDVVLVLARPQGGRVAVHETAAPGAARRYEADPGALLARVEGALAAGRRVSVEPYLLREWLAGRG